MYGLVQAMCKWALVPCCGGVFAQKNGHVFICGEVFFPGVLGPCICVCRCWRRVELR